MNDSQRFFLLLTLAVLGNRAAAKQINKKSRHVRLLRSHILFVLYPRPKRDIHIRHRILQQTRCPLLQLICLDDRMQIFSQVL